MTSIAENVTSDFRIFPTLKLALSIVLKHYIPFTLLAFLYQLPNLLNIFYGPGNYDFFSPDLYFNLKYGAVILGFILINYALNIIITRVTFQNLTGIKTGLVNCLVSHSLKKSSLIFLGIIYVLHSGLKVLVIVSYSYMNMEPSTMVTIIQFLSLLAFITAIFFYVLIPVLIIEKLSIKGSLKKSLELSKGNYLSIVGILLFTIVLKYILQTIYQLLLTMNFLPITGSEIAIIVPGMIEAFTFVYSIVIVTVSYHFLILSKEPKSTNQVAAVFD
ncbi:MAG: hypothetical protein V7776_10865 [Halopseudomonas aestusnigri]